MSEGVRCPVAGCPYGEDEEKSRDQVKRHINAKSGEDHADIEALYAALDDPDGDDQDDDGGEAADEEAESQDSGTDESEEESTEMPTDEEYQQQHEQGEPGAEPTDTDAGDEEGGESTESSDGGEAGLGLPALDQRTVVLLVAVVGALFLVYVVLNRDADEQVDAAEPTDEETESGGQRAVTNEEVSLIES